MLIDYERNAKWTKMFVKCENCIKNLQFVNI